MSPSSSKIQEVSCSLQQHVSQKSRVIALCIITHVTSDITCCCKEHEIPCTMGGLFSRIFSGAVGLKVGDRLGRGSYGGVYRGTYNGRPVAVKKIHDILVESARENAQDLEKLLEDFRRECDILRAAKDPHIVEFIGVFNDETQEGGVLLVMELMDQTLETFLKDNRGNLSKEKQVDICQQIASGLRYLHHQDPQILHRDLKPSNILLDKDGRFAKIGDFGQAKFRPSDIQYLTTTQPGTVLYMPPEALRDKETRFTDRGDVFSLGVVMLEVATQEPPSCSMFGIGIVLEVERRAKDLSKVPDDHPLKALIRSCLKDDPKKRPTIEEVHLELFKIVNQKLYTEVMKNEPKVSEIIKCVFVVSTSQVD